MSLGPVMLDVVGTELTADAGLSVVEKLDVSPKHAKATDKTDPLYAARVKEITSLYRLKCS